MNINDTPNPGKPLDPRLLLYMFIAFFVIPGMMCGGCVAASSYIPRKARLPVEPRTAPNTPVPVNENVPEKK